MSRSLVLTLTALVLLSPTARGQGEGKQYAILVGVQQHDQRHLDLAYTLNDAKALKKVLMERAGIPDYRILELTDDAPAQRKPKLANLRREVPAFLKKMTDQDRVLIFFAGHGFLDVNTNTTYIVASDSIQDKLAKTALPASEVKGWLEGCPAKVKFFIMDCCHAGGSRDIPKANAQKGEDIAKAIDPASLVILASCRSNELSWEWNQRKHGMFTYWLCRALEGGADDNNDGELDEAEVHRYVNKQVSLTARQVLERTQTPVRMIGRNVDGVPVLLKLRAEAPESVCRRLAEQLDLAIRGQQLKKVGVLEFGMHFGNQTGLAKQSLPAYLAGRMRQTLTQLSGGDYQVLTEEQINQALSKSRGFKFENTGDPGSVKQLGKQAGNMDGLITGLLRPRANEYNLQCELVRVSNYEQLALAGGVVKKSEDILGDTHSFDNGARPKGGPYDKKVRDHAEKTAEKGNPILDQENFPFHIELWAVDSEGGEKQLEYVRPKNNDLTDVVVGVREGQVIQVRVRNQHAHRVALMLFVDGLNAINKRRDRLGHGSAFVINPFTKTKRPTTIKGWYVPTGKVGPGGEPEFAIREFKIVDVAESVAARQGYSESLGKITLAFYSDKADPSDRGARVFPGLGIGEGAEERRYVGTADGFTIGGLLGVVHIRYVDEQSLRK